MDWTALFRAICFRWSLLAFFVNGEKMTLDTEEQIRFWAHCQLARSYYYNQGILSHEQFDKIDWPSVHGTLHDLLRLFQIWAAKHVNNLAGTMTFSSHQDGRCKLCPSCQMCEETATMLHIVLRQDALRHWSNQPSMLNGGLEATTHTWTCSIYSYGTSVGVAQSHTWSAPLILTYPQSCLVGKSDRNSAEFRD